MRINSETICLGAGARGLRGKREPPAGDGGPHVQPEGGGKTEEERCLVIRDR